MEINIVRALRNHSLVSALVGIAIFGVVTYLEIREPKYQSDSLILISNQNTVPLVTPQKEENVDQKKNAQATDIEILKSRALLTRAIKRLHTKEEITPAKLEDNLTLHQSKGTDILLVSYVDSDPVKAKKTLEALVSTYLDYSSESRLSPLKNAIGFIERILPTVQSGLIISSEKLTTFKRDNGINDSDASLAAVYQRKQDINQKLFESQASLNELQSLYKSLEHQAGQIGQTSKGIIPSAILNQDSTYQALWSQLNAVEIQYSSQEINYRPNHPIMRQLQERRDRLNKLIQKRISQVMGKKEKVLSSGPIQQDLAVQLLKARIDLTAQQQRLRDLRWLKTKADVDFSRTTRLQPQYKELERQYRLNSQEYESFLTKLRELKIRDAQEYSSWKIVQPPNLPNLPISPGLFRSLLVALVPGALAAAGVAYLLERFGRSIKDPEKIKELTNLPLLAEIPFAGRDKPLLLNEQPHLTTKIDPFSESVRSLALLILGKKTSSKTITIVSSVELEGKSTITYNLASALAELGQKVLIVDTNMLKPTIDKICDLPNVAGLSTVLSTNTGWQELVQQSEPMGSSHNYQPSENSSWSDSLHTLVSTKLQQITPGYLSPDVLTAGPSLTNSGAWLASEKMENLLNQWRNSYDFVLIDTHSPRNAQALFLKVDELILVAGMKLLTRTTLTETMKVLQTSNSNIAGVVVNQSR